MLCLGPDVGLPPSFGTVLDEKGLSKHLTFPSRPAAEDSVSHPPHLPACLRSSANVSGIQAVPDRREGIKRSVVDAVLDEVLFRGLGKSWQM